MLSDISKSKLVENTTPAIEMKNVSKSFDELPVFQDVNLSILAGEFLCLLGPSGCGKSTLLRLIGGLLEATQGIISISDASPQEQRERFAFVFQSPRLVPWHDVLGNVTMAMHMRGSARDAHTRRHATEMLELVGLTDHITKYPFALSGGQRQRVAIARALAVDPEIILMDEPFSALDPNTRTHLRNEVLAIWKRTGKTIVFVTHDIDEALFLADRIVLLAGSPAEIKATAIHDEPRPRQVQSSPSCQRIRQLIEKQFDRTSSLSLQRQVA